MTLLLPKISLDHNQCAQQLQNCSSLAILRSSSLVVPLQHVCSAFLDIPEVTPPTKLWPSVNYKLDCRSHKRNPVQFRFMQSPWIALTTSQDWSPPLVYSWIYEAKREVFPKLPQITLMVVNSLMTCIVSDKQLTSGLAGISMTLVLLSLGSL